MCSIPLVDHTDIEIYRYTRAERERERKGLYVYVCIIYAMYTRVRGEGARLGVEATSKPILAKTREGEGREGGKDNSNCGLAEGKFFWGTPLF